MIFLVLLTIIVSTLSWYLVKLLIAYLHDKQIVDTPNERTLHQGDVPRGGGLAIIFLTSLAIIFIGILSGRISMFLALLICVLAWASLSWLDDRHGLSPRSRFLVQIIYALFMLLAFGWVEQIQLTSEYYLLIPKLGFLLSLFGVVWLANLYNFMDGMDGLAASQAIVASATLSFWLWQYGDQGLAIVCLVLAAGSYGFLIWNWHPAKIFMGDVGSVTIGAFFATMILIGVSRYDMPVISFVILLSVFIFDASITILRRLFKREKIWLPHRSHYYQRLAKMGFSHSKIVITLIVIMTLSSLIASITLAYRDSIGIAILLELVLLFSCIIIVEVLDSNKRIR